jgi:hypothetical protein
MPEAPYVFISYASADRERVLPIVERLEAAGVTVWIDRTGIHGGANYAKVISDAIKDASALVLMTSPASLASRNVRQELALGWRFETPYLPLLLDSVEIPDDLAYWLEGSQWIELLDRAERDWLADATKALQPYGIAVRPSNAGGPPGSTRRARPLLVGREREQVMLREHLDRMLAGQGGTILIGGEAGIGKTTLVDDLTIEAEEQGCLVLWGHAYDLSVTPPYGPWLEIFRQYRPVSAGLPPLPPFIGNADELAKVGSQAALLDAMAGFFSSVATQHPLLLVLDDLHWADQASLDSFRFLARQVATQRVLLVATYRSDELHRRHPLYALLPVFVREAGAKRLDVRPLDQEGHRTLIQERYALSEHDHDQLEHYLSERAEGNPLYMGELLRTLEDEGVLTRVGSAWHLGGLAQLRLPALLRQVIEGRLNHLQRETRDLLQVGAVIGQTVPLELWKRVSAADDQDLIVALEQGRSAQLIEDGSTADSWRFHHALIREALYEDLVSLRRRPLHQRVAEQLQRLPAPDPDVVAYHYQQANDQRAADWLITAGWRAELRFALQSARERYDVAQEMLLLDAERTELRGWLLWQLARVVRYTAPESALVYLDEADRIARASGNQPMQIVTLAERGLIRALMGSLDVALSEIGAAIASYDAISPEVWAVGTDSYAHVFNAAQARAEWNTPWDLSHVMESRRAIFTIGLADIGHFEQALAHWEAWRSRWTEPWATAASCNARFGVRYAEWALGRPDRELRDHLGDVQNFVDLQNYLSSANVIEELIFWQHVPYDTDNLT